ncbi:unnamed protein product [Prunus brigantina]
MLLLITCHALLMKTMEMEKFCLSTNHSRMSNSLSFKIKSHGTLILSIILLRLLIKSPAAAPFLLDRFRSIYFSQVHESIIIQNYALIRLHF